MAGSTLDQFTTFWNSTGPRYLTGPEEIINMAVKNTYTMPRLMTAHGMEEMIQSGEVIRDRVFFKVTKNWKRINPDAELSYNNPQQGQIWTVPWCIGVDHTGWNKWEFSLNSDQMRPEYLAHVFKKVRKQKFMDLYTDICNSMDAECWAQPNVTEMESTTQGTAPFSIPVFINEYGNQGPGTAGTAMNGLPPATHPGGAWTTKQGLTPGAASVDGKWDCYRRTYDYDAGGTSGGGTTGIFAALTAAFLNTTFDRLPKEPAYSEKTTSPNAILTQTQGVVNFEHAVRTNQDEFRGVGKVTGEDPAYMGPTFRGIPIQHITEMDTALIYPTGSAANKVTATLGTWDGRIVVDGAVVANATELNSGPRYVGVNGKYMKWVFHGGQYLSFEPIITPEKQPFNRVQVVSVTNNFVARSLVHQFMVYPSGLAAEGGSGNQIVNA